MFNFLFNGVVMEEINEKMVDNIKQFDAKEEFFPDVNGYLEQKLIEFGVSPKIKSQALICCEEIFINISKYAYGDSTGVMWIRVEKVDDVLEIEFTDRGKPFNPLAKADPDITLSAEERSIGGLGIFMVKKTMDKVDYQYLNGKNILSLYKKLA